jgi:MscS family membrane protein
MNDFFDKTFYGSTIGEWLLALIIILSGILFAKAVYWIFGKVIKKITAKTKTKFDDIMVDRLQGPIIFAIISITFWYGILILRISDRITIYIDKLYYGLIFINIAWLV